MPGRAGALAAPSSAPGRRHRRASRRRLHGSRRLPFKPARLRSARCRQRPAAGRGRQEAFSSGAAEPRPLPRGGLKTGVRFREGVGRYRRKVGRRRGLGVPPSCAAEGVRRRDVAPAPAERSLCTPPPAALPPPRDPAGAVGRAPRADAGCSATTASAEWLLLRNVNKTSFRCRNFNEFRGI